VVDLARASRACRTFQAAFGRQMAEEQKARYDLADQCVGHKRILCVAELANRYLKGEPIHPALDKEGHNICQISPNAALHVDPQDSLLDYPVSDSRPLTCEPGDVYVDVWFNNSTDACPSMRFLVTEKMLDG
jgi:hypothetical protein